VTASRIAGARAFNVDLATDDVASVRAWAKSLRETGGGLPGVRALGFALEPGRCQVAMNLLDYRRTAPAAAFEAVASLAGRSGVAVLRSELVGCAPRAAWPEGTAERLKEPEMTADRRDLRILETWLPGGMLEDHPGLDPTTLELGG
jgi:glutamate formiminotransferase